MSFSRSPSLPCFGATLLAGLCLLGNSAFGQASLDLLDDFNQLRTDIPMTTNGLIIVTNPTLPATSGQWASLESTSGRSVSDDGSTPTTLLTLPNLSDESAWEIDPATVVSAVNLNGPAMTLAGVNFTSTDPLVQASGEQAYNCWPSGGLQIYSDTVSRRTIDNGTISTSITLPDRYAEGTRIESVKVRVEFHQVHTYMRDLIFSLDDKVLFEGECGGKFQFASFDPAGAAHNGCFDRDGGTMQAKDPAALTQYVGLDPNGLTITLNLQDRAFADSGLFGTWVLEIATKNTPPPLADLAGSVIGSNGAIDVQLDTVPGTEYMAELVFWTGTCAAWIERRVDVTFNGTNATDLIAEDVLAPRIPSGPTILQHRFTATGTNSTFTIHPEDTFGIPLENGSTPLLSGVVLHQVPAAPVATGVQLVSTIGRVFFQGFPDVLFGNEIVPPATDVFGATLPEGVSPYAYWRAEPVRPGERVQTNGVLGVIVPTNFVERYYYSPHADRVYASIEGQTVVTWVTRLPLVDGQFDYGVLEQEYSVSPGTDLPIRRIFWTEGRYTGPTVEIPSLVQDLHIVYTGLFPERVPDSEAVIEAAFTNVAPETRTLWLDEFSNALRAINKEGRVVIEYLGAARGIQENNQTLRESLGFEVVDVIQEVAPIEVTSWIGEQILPKPDGETTDPEAPELTPSPVSPGSLEVRYTHQHFVGDRTVYYAIRENEEPLRVQFHWLEKGIKDILWPTYLNSYRLVWPDDAGDYPAHFSRPIQGGDPSTNSFVALPRANTPELVYQDGDEASLDFQGRLQMDLGADPDNTNYALLRFSSGNDFWYLRVYSATEDNFLAKDPLPATVGERIVNPAGTDSVAGYIDLDCPGCRSDRSAYNVDAYIDPFAAGGVADAETGAIIPVNARPGKNELRVWWFNRIDPPADAADSFEPIWFPGTVNNYVVSYPADPRQIVMASNQGSGDLNAAEANGSIYFQNDPEQPGYNPNEEHALMLSGRAYVLRDDLNDPATSSKPVVLVNYTDPDDERPRMAVFDILRETASERFRYPAVAGKLLQGPMPLPILPIPVQDNGQSPNQEILPDDPPQNTNTLAAHPHYQHFTYEDRKGQKWVYRGPHPDADTNTTQVLSMRYYYNTMPGFAFPDASGHDQAPAVGTITPYLRPLDAADNPVGDPVTGESLTIEFEPVWPEIVPELRFAETLGLPKFGLPQIRGQRSLQVIYQGSTTPTNGTGSVVLHDPTRAKAYSLSDDGLSKIPDSIATSSANQKIYFQNLPSHLQDRLYFDPLAGEMGQLVLIGEFKDEIVGEDYYLLNVLSATEVETAKDLCDPGDENHSKWDEAIDGLSTTVERFIENPQVRGTYIVDPDGDHQTFTTTEIVGLTSPPARPDPRTNATDLGFYDEAVDSYALTAVGGGSGYVTLIAGNGEAFTPEEEPVQMFVIRVGGGLYRGQLKPVVSANPLSENVTVQHTGDFAAQTPDFEFEWRKAPPVNGLSPAVYEFDDEPASVAASFDISRIPDGFNPTEGPAIVLPGPIAVNSGSSNMTLRLDGQITINATIPELHTVYVGLTHSPQDTVTVLVNGIVAFRTGVDLPAPDVPAGVRSAMGEVTAIYTADKRLFDLDGADAISLEVTSTADTDADTFLGLRVGIIKRNDRTDANYLFLSRSAGKNRHLVSGAGIDTLGDNYYIMRYRPLEGHQLTPPGGWPDDLTGWSAWTDPALVEGWIKRVLAGINPFNQRISDFFENAIDTDVSLLSQAGTRYEGDIALNLDAVQEEGLIAIYETVLKRGIDLSIGGTPEVDYAPANDALLLAAGYLADLYMALGNEAYADAANPSILYDSQAIGTIADDAIAVDFDSVFRSSSTARFAFEGQVASLLEEELHLLRGRDDFLAPGIEISPVYNKLFWNYTRGIDAGEVIYALNYNITEKDDDTADGRIDAADASRLYPQGHGDAYGHYLTVLSYYYRLLTDGHFTWGTRSEAVNVLGVPVSVDYLDERKFAAAAAALGRTTTQIQTLEHRRSFQEAPEAGWEHLSEIKENPRTGRTRRWSFDDWSHRSGQGTLYHWVTANVILPEEDTVNEGIQKIDRTTVPELDELAASGEAIQLRMDSANAGLNPLDLTADSVVFDISPQAVADGETHFEQAFARAVRALQNAQEVFERATDSSRLLRAIENQNQNLNASVEDQERAFMLDLWDIYGSPYAGDVGPGKTYPQGYEGPDLYRYMVIDRPFEIFARERLFKFGDTGTREYQLQVSDSDFQSRIDDPFFFAGLSNQAETEGFMTYIWERDQGPYQFSTPDMGKRPYLGTLQYTAAEVRQAEEELMNALNSMEFKRTLFLKELDKFEADMANRVATLVAQKRLEAARVILIEGRSVIKAVRKAFEMTTRTMEDITTGTVEGVPKVVGVASDATAPARAALLAALVSGKAPVTAADVAAAQQQSIAELVFFLNEQATKIVVLGLEEEKHWRAQAADLNAKYRTARGQWREVDAKYVAYIRALERFRVEENNGDTVRWQREVYRKRAAAIVQGYRTRDVAFRSFRTESLEQYQTLLDWAAKYTFLAAQAYDYETGLLNSDDGRAFMGDIIASRSLGILGEDGQPTFAASQLGDPGLAGLLAKLKSDWDVVEGRLGFNNPDQYGTTFSLREEYYRIPRSKDGDRQWKEKLTELTQANLLTDADVAAYALQVDQTDGTPTPGFVLSFPAVIKTGKNFFDKPLAGGDNRFTESNFATKIAAAGVVFEGYKGMEPCLVCPNGVVDNSDPNDPNALSATPHVYLMPVGADTMMPPLGGGALRSWNVLDHALPMPFDIGAIDDGSAAPAPGATSLGGTFKTARKHQSFRAVAQEEFFAINRSHEYTNSRLIGRSVANTEWKLVIPAAELLNDPDEGMRRFIDSVDDIKLHFRTYSYSGN